MGFNQNYLPWRYNKACRLTRQVEMDLIGPTELSSTRSTAWRFDQLLGHPHALRHEFWRVAESHTRPTTHNAHAPTQPQHTRCSSLTDNISNWSTLFFLKTSVHCMRPKVMGSLLLLQQNEGSNELRYTDSFLSTIQQTLITSFINKTTRNKNCY